MSDTANSASDKYWGEAYNTWQFGGRGIVNDLGVTWAGASDLGVKTDGTGWKVLLGRYAVPHAAPNGTTALENDEYVRSSSHN